MPKTASSEVLARQVGETLRSTRLELGLSQADLASRLGVSAPYVAKIESGRGNITVAQLANFAVALGTGLDIRLPIPKRASVTLPERPKVQLST